MHEWLSLTCITCHCACLALCTAPFAAENGWSRSGKAETGLQISLLSGTDLLLPNLWSHQHTQSSVSGCWTNNTVNIMGIQLPKHTIPTGFLPQASVLSPHLTFKMVFLALAPQHTHTHTVPFDIFYTGDCIADCMLYFLVQMLRCETSQVMFGCQMPAKCILFVLGSCWDSEVEAWHDELFNPTNLHQYEMNGAGSSVLPQQKTGGVDEKGRSNKAWSY